MERIHHRFEKIVVLTELSIVSGRIHPNPETKGASSREKSVIPESFIPDPIHPSYDIPH